ncbi:MAG: hemerythrin domain-containing protein [Brachybacterium paraconglomeratum]|nr:hemerythrin domain-containing protein [Brachybacterium paraconglomeratum]
MCSYCGCRSLTVIGRLSEEHEHIVNHLGELREACATADQGAVAQALDALVAHLDPHTSSEERGLFHVLRRDPEFTEHVDSLHEEHVGIDALVEELRAGDLDVIDELVDALYEHIDKEENGLFPAAAIALDGPDWEEVVSRTDHRRAPLPG